MALLELNVSPVGAETGAARAKAALASVKAEAIGAEASLKKFQASAQAFGTTASGAFARVTTSIQSFGRTAATAFRGAAATVASNTRILALQLSQVGQQAMATGNIFQALAIQLPDIGLAFGAVGAAVGLVAGIALPILVSAFSDTGEEARELKDILDDLTSATRNYVSASEASIESAEKLAERFGTLAKEGRDALAALAELERIRSLEEIAAAVETLTTAFGGLSGDTIAGFGSEYEETLGTLRREFDLTGQQALAVAGALRSVQEAQGITAQAQAATELNSVLLQVFGSVQAMPPAFRDTYEAAAVVAREAANIKGQTEEAADAAVLLGDNMLTVQLRYANARTEAGALLKATLDAASAFAAVQQRLRAGGLQYSGRGSFRGDEASTPSSNGPTQFVYDGPRLDAANNPVAPRGGGGGGGAKSAVSAVDTLRASYENLRASVDDAYDAQLKFAKAEEIINKAVEAGIISKSEAASTLDLLKQKYGEVGQAADFWKGIQDDLESSIARAIVSGEGLAETFSNIAKSIAEALIQAALFGSGPLGGGTGLLSGLIGSIFPSAKGNVFAGGNVVPFARGGVVGSSTFFPMRDGRTGMMGEAGPEAIMPLKRGADGKLGVEGGSGAGANNVAVFLDPDLFEQWARSNKAKSVLVGAMQEAGFVRSA